MNLKSHQVNNLNNFIGGWFINNINICNRIIQAFKKSPEKYIGLVSSGIGSKINTVIKNSIDCTLNDLIEYKPYVNELQNVCDNYIKMYPWCNRYSPWTISETINVQYYPPNGGYYYWHTERNGIHLPSVNRHLVFMTYLNDVNEGGETEFYHQNVKIKPQKGLTIIWPADWTFTHRGITSVKEEKYIVTGWYSYINSEK